jgi:hypothetical protein
MKNEILYNNAFTLTKKTIHGLMGTIIFSQNHKLMIMENLSIIM